jgi:hypothetical protein
MNAIYRRNAKAKKLFGHSMDNSDMQYAKCHNIARVAHALFDARQKYASDICLCIIVDSSIQKKIHQCVKALGINNVMYMDDTDEIPTNSPKTVCVSIWPLNPPDHGIVILEDGEEEEELSTRRSRVKEVIPKITNTDDPWTSTYQSGKSALQSALFQTCPMNPELKKFVYESRYLGNNVVTNLFVQLGGIATLNPRACIEYDLKESKTLFTSSLNATMQSQCISQGTNRECDIQSTLVQRLSKSGHHAMNRQPIKHATCLLSCGRHALSEDEVDRFTNGSWNVTCPLCDAASWDSLPFQIISTPESYLLIVPHIMYMHALIELYPKTIKAFDVSGPQPIALATIDALEKTQTMHAFETVYILTNDHDDWRRFTNAFICLPLVKNATLLVMQ